MAMIDREGDERPRLKARCFKTEMTKCNGGASTKAAESPNGGDLCATKATGRSEGGFWLRPEGIPQRLKPPCASLYGTAKAAP